MFRRLFNWIDAQNDRINPIAVRDLRKLKRWYGLETLTLLALLLSVIVYAGILIYYKRIDPDATWDAPNQALAILLVIGSIFLYIPCLTACFIPIGWLNQSQRNDELFELIPLSPKEHVWGYIQSSLILSVYSICLGLPFFVAARMVGPISDVVLLLPILAPFVALVGMLFLLSFMIRIKKQWEAVVIVLGMMYLGALPIQLPVIATMFLWGEIFGLPELYSTGGFGLISLLFLFPIGLTILGLTAYRLSIYHFKYRRRSLWLGVVLNIGVYSLLSLILSATYLGAAVVYFKFFP